MALIILNNVTVNVDLVAAEQTGFNGVMYQVSK